MVMKNAPSPTNPDSVDRLRSSIDRLKGRDEDNTRETIDRMRAGAKGISRNEEAGRKIEALMKERLGDGPEDISKLDTFLLNVPENQLNDKEMVKEFMGNMLDKENVVVDQRIDEVREGDNEAFLNFLVMSKYFIRTVESSLKNDDYTNKNGPVVEWFNAKRRYYKQKMEMSENESKEVYKEVIKRIETLGRTLILE